MFLIHGIKNLKLSIKFQPGHKFESMSNCTEGKIMHVWAFLLFVAIDNVALKDKKGEKKVINTCKV